MSLSSRLCADLRLCRDSDGESYHDDAISRLVRADGQLSTIHQHLSPGQSPCPANSRSSQVLSRCVEIDRGSADDLGFATNRKGTLNRIENHRVNAQMLKLHPTHVAYWRCCGGLSGGRRGPGAPEICVFGSCGRAGRPLRHICPASFCLTTFDAIAKSICPG